MLKFWQDVTAGVASAYAAAAKRTLDQLEAAIDRNAAQRSTLTPARTERAAGKGLFRARASRPLQ